MKNLVLGILAFILVGGFYYVMNNKSANKTTNSGMPVPQSNTSTKEMVATKNFVITAKSWIFEPSEIRVLQGERVRLKIKNVDVDHGFSLPDFNVDVKLKPGVEETVEFTADKKGKFTFFCSVLCGTGHKDMKGMLIVE